MPETEPEGLRQRPTHGLRIKPLAMRIATRPRGRHRREERGTRAHELLGSEERLLRGRGSGRRPTRPGNTPNRPSQLTGRRDGKDPTRATNNRRRRPSGQLAKPSRQPPAHLTTLRQSTSRRSAINTQRQQFLIRKGLDAVALNFLDRLLDLIDAIDQVHWGLLCGWGLSEDRL